MDENNNSYIYVSIPYVHTAPVFGRMVPYSVYWAVESYLLGRACPADRLQLINGVVSYRVLKQYLLKLPSDSQGPYINLFSFGLYRFSEIDPSLSAKPVTSREEWIPIV